MNEGTENSPEALGNPDKPWEWKPGQSGNPNGRPKDQFSFMGILRSALAEENKSGHSVGERLVARYIKLGLAGNGQALEALMARIDGKPAQSLTLKGDSAEPLHVRHSARLEAPVKPKPKLPEPAEVDGDALARALVWEAELGDTRANPEPALEQEQEAAEGEVVPMCQCGHDEGEHAPTFMYGESPWSCRRAGCPCASFSDPDHQAPGLAE